MKVTHSAALGADNSVSKTSRKRGADRKARAGLFQVSHDSAAPFVAETMTSQSILALQAIYDDTSEGSQAFNQGKRALVALQDLQVQILEGRLQPDSLAQLKTFLDQKNMDDLPADLQQAHQMIIQRISIELAKLSSVSTTPYEK